MSRRLKNILPYWSLRKKILVGSIIIFSLIFWFSLPSVLFQPTFSTVLEDKDGELLGASIAADGQWRFPQPDSVPSKFTTALITFEDKHFYDHPGVNPFSMARAFSQNIKAGKIISGGSTLSMQVIRLSRMGKSRTYLQKLLEMFLALRLELSYSKEEILKLYVSHAPFGGNIVGLDAAAWRYYGRNAHELSWSEASLLAVLPNSPSLIYPGKNQGKLLEKRNRLLKKLHQAGYFDTLSYKLAISEPLPGKPFPLPHLARHLVTRCIKDGLEGNRIVSTVDFKLQERVHEVVQRHFWRLKVNQIYNAAAIVLDVQTGDVIAYIGNTDIPGSSEFGDEVDVITARRSTGSILKPFLYASMMQEGKILPNTLVKDIPTFIRGFAPQNFAKTFDGAVHADEALSRSLNVPAVKMLQDYGVEKLHYRLKQTGMQTLNQPPGHYGLSLILGGAEGSLWDLSGIYASMARSLTNYFRYPEPFRYNLKDYHPANYIKEHSYQTPEKGNKKSSWYNAASLWFTFFAMVEVNRPDTEVAWKYFSSSRRIAWKTGTSFGNRDGWAIGFNPKYLVGVWVGNADGEGRPGLTGIDAAAPVMFDIFNFLPSSSWFRKPLSDMVYVPVCRSSGHRASTICTPVDTLPIPKAGLKTTVCPYHELVHLDKTETWRVNSDCSPIDEMVHKAWFVLPPVEEWFYKSKHASYKTLPLFSPKCQMASANIHSVDIIYPKQNSKIFVPRELDGTPGRAVFEVAHRNPSSRLFWHLDGEYLGETKTFHQMGLNPVEGAHVLTLVDEAGEVVEQHFEVLSR